MAILWLSVLTIIVIVLFIMFVYDDNNNTKIDNVDTRVTELDSTVAINTDNIKNNTDSINANTDSIEFITNTALVALYDSLIATTGSVSLLQKEDSAILSKLGLVDKRSYANYKAVLENKKEEFRDKVKQQQKVDEYNIVVKDADSLVNIKDYSGAKAKYRYASILINDPYPLAMIDSIDVINAKTNYLKSLDNKSKLKKNKDADTKTDNKKSKGKKKTTKKGKKKFAQKSNSKGKTKSRHPIPAYH